jgi:hypothetical protein
MAISRKTFKTVKEILRELDEQRSASRGSAGGDASSGGAPRATAKRTEGASETSAPDRNGSAAGRDARGDQLIG